MDNLHSVCPGGTSGKFEDERTCAKDTPIDKQAPAHRRAERWSTRLSPENRDAIGVECVENVQRFREVEAIGRSKSEEPRKMQQEAGASEG
ncbi:hypothetical protein NDU88_003786 [Pleurodeles waltl]|uniref:Uncharacterized protein n=1 Tax=Pleurodeles waltl TaxID=8319 RepID=A0AAV7N144_PLEWA|nr:hypothetical protein NDU88_003786 [Pleurodeles waltl]